MTYLEIHCGVCGCAWKVGVTGDYHREEARTCPQCAAQIDSQTWENQVLPALGAVHDANFELARDGKPFTIDVLTTERK